MSVRARVAPLRVRARHLVIASTLSLAACTHASPPIPTLPRSGPVAACTTTPAPKAAAIDELRGAAIARISIRAPVGVETAVLLPLLATHPATKLDPETLRADVRRLWALGIASQVNVTAEPSPEGYAIELDLAPPERVREVVFEGARASQLATFNILEGTLHDPQRLQRLAVAATAWWRQHGYLHAEITAVARPDCDGVTIHVLANLGRRYTLASIAVTGSALPASFERELGAVDRVGGVYREDLFEHDLGELVDRHHVAGWLDAHVEAPVMHVDEATGHVTVAAHLIAGARLRFGPLAIEGGTAAQRRLVERDFGDLRGRWYDGDAIDTRYQRLERDLDGQHVRPSYRIAHDHGRVELTLEIEAAR